MLSQVRVRSIALPADSALHARVGPGDFLDCYAIASQVSARMAAEIIVDFPAWVRGLQGVRALVTWPFGLLQEGPGAGEKLGPFPVEQTTEKEVIAGFDDRHLDFRVSVMAENGQVSLATWVHAHNMGGRLYLSAIMPFHILVVRNALARVARASEGALRT